MSFDEGQHRLFLDHRPEAGLVCLALAFPGPDLVEGPKQHGWAGLVFEILRAGGGRVPEETVSGRFDRWGGGLRSVTTPVAGLLVYDCLPEFLEESLDLLMRICGQGRFPERLFKRERAARLAGIREQRDDPAANALLRVREWLLPESALAVAPLGRDQDLRETSVGQIGDFCSQLLGRTDSCLAISGAFDPARVRARLGPFWGDGCGEMRRQGLGAVGGESFTEEVGHDREQSVVVQAFPGVGMAKEDYRIQNLVAACLNGLSGPLFEEVREKHGLAYYSSARVVAGVSGGLFSIVSGCERSRAGFLADRVRRILDRIGREGFSDSEWDAGMAQVRSGLVLARQRAGWRATRLALRGVLGLEADLGEADERFLDQTGKDRVRRWCEAAFAGNRESRLSFLGK